MRRVKLFFSFLNSYMFPKRPELQRKTKRKTKNEKRKTKKHFQFHHHDDDDDRNRFEINHYRMCN